MDFSRVDLSDDDQKFLDEARTFLREIVTEDVIRRDRETGDNFDEGVHLALGAAGYLEREWKPDSERAFTRVQRRIWELEKRRAHVPWVTSGTTAMIARSVEKFGSPGTQGRGAAPGVQRARPDVPGLHRTRGRLGCGHVQDPRGARR